MEVLEDALGTQWKKDSGGKGENSYHYPSYVLVAGLVMKLTGNQIKKRKKTHNLIHMLRKSEMMIKSMI